MNFLLAFKHPTGDEVTLLKPSLVCSAFNSFLAALTLPCRDRKDMAGEGLSRQFQGLDAESFPGSHVNICPRYRVS